MTVGFARPHVSHLMFQFYERPVHPELFQIHAERTVVGEKYAATLQICDAGHVVQFRRDGHTCVEVMGDGGQPRPTHKRTVDNKLSSGRDASKWLPGGLHYQASFQLELLDEEVFQHCHDEFVLDCRTAAVAFRFPAAHRWATGPVSLIRMEPAADSLLVHTFHTFPESAAVVRTQSLFEC